MLTNTATMLKGNILSERAMIARLNISQWSARKLDRNVTDKINREHNAAADAGRYNKLLVSKDAIAKIQSIAGAARLEHMARTLAWQDGGGRILSSIGYQEYTEKMQEFRREFESEIESFVAGYPDFVLDRKAKLGTLFQESDYPTVEKIRAKFEFRYSFDPVPDASDFRVDMSNAQAEAIRADIESRLQQATQTAINEVWTRISELVSHMAEKLRAYKPGTKTKRAEGTFHDSLVENIRDLVGLMPSLNVTGDKRIASMAKRLERELCDVAADELRDNPSTREHVAATAEAILESVADYMA